MAEKIFTINLTDYIESRFWEGQHPHIRNRRVRVSWIAAYAHTWGISQTALDLSLTESQVAAALLYYEQHKAEIDALESAEEEAYKHLYEH